MCLAWVREQICLRAVLYREQFLFSDGGCMLGCLLSVPACCHQVPNLTELPLIAVGFGCVWAWALPQMRVCSARRPLANNCQHRLKHDKEQTGEAQQHSEATRHHGSWGYGPLFAIVSSCK